MTLFGEPFDSYTEAEAIAEGYIVDVAASIISYKTLYNLHCPIVPKPDGGEALPQGRRLQGAPERGISGRRTDPIQGRSDAPHLREEREAAHRRPGQGDDRHQSRVAGLRYFKIIKEKLKERGADYKVLYAFSDFVHPETNAAISEHAVNELQDRRTDRKPFRGRRLSDHGRGEQISNRLRPAIARRNVPRQAGGGP